jgi:hypothetical protein
MSYTNPKFIETHASATVRKKLKGIDINDPYYLNSNFYIFKPENGLFFLKDVFVINEQVSDVSPDDGPYSVSFDLWNNEQMVTNFWLGSTDIAASAGIDYRWSFFITKDMPLIGQIPSPPSGYPPQNVPKTWIVSFVVVLERLSD